MIGDVPLGCRGELVFLTGSASLSVCFPDSGLGRLLREAHPVVAPAPVPATARLCVLRTPEGFRLRRPDGSTETLDADEDGLLRRVEEIVVAHELARRRDEVLLRAAGAVAPDGALLVVGVPGSGKSSVALAWGALGLPHLGDPLVALGQGGRARALARHLEAPPDRLGPSGLGALRPRQGSGGRVRVSPLWFRGGMASEPAPVRVLAELVYDPGAPPAVVDAQAGDAVRAAVQRSRRDAAVLHGGRRPPSPGSGPGDPVDVALGGADVLRLTYSDSVAAARLLADRGGWRH